MQNDFHASFSVQSSLIGRLVSIHLRAHPDWTFEHAIRAAISDHLEVHEKHPRHLTDMPELWALTAALAERAPAKTILECFGDAARLRLEVLPAVVEQGFTVPLDRPVRVFRGSASPDLTRSMIDVEMVPLPGETEEA